MYTPRQIWHHVTPKAQLLIALSLATVLAFSAGLAAGIYRRATYLPAVTTDGNAVPAVTQPPQAAPAVQQRGAVAAPVAGAGSAYDGGHYGSPVATRQAAPFLAPCAFVAQIADAGNERREVAYRAAESSANWRAVVGQQLMERGWTPSDPGVFGAPRAIYLCITPFGVGHIVERAELHGGAREARITVIRRLYWAWPQLIDWR